METTKVSEIPDFVRNIFKDIPADDLMKIIRNQSFGKFFGGSTFTSPYMLLNTDTHQMDDNIIVNFAEMALVDMRDKHNWITVFCVFVNIDRYPLGTGDIDILGWQIVDEKRTAEFALYV